MAGLLRRLKNVISAEAHDIIDSHESPDRIARQLVREATDKVAAAQKLTINAVASEKQLAQQLKDHSEKAAKAQSIAARALSHQDEVGARRGLEDKLHHQKLVDTLTPQLASARSNSDSLKKQLLSLQQQLNTLKTEQLAIEARFNGAKATGKIDQMSADLAMADDTDSRLQRANSMVSVMEARNQAVAEVNAVTHPDASMDSNADLEMEMENLRKQVGG